MSAMNKKADAAPSEPTALFYQPSDWSGKVFGDKRMVFGTYPIQKPAPLIERAIFEPLPGEKRFTVTAHLWGPTHPRYTADLWRTGYAADEKWDRYEAEAKECQPPASLLDLPQPHARQDVEWTIKGEMLRTREETFAWAADKNARALQAAWSRGESTAGIEWAVVVEVGKSPHPLHAVHYITHLDETGAGYLEPCQTWPIRIVRPTDEEVAAYPVPQREEVSA